MPKETSLDRFSTVAHFELLTADSAYSVAQVAPTFLVLTSPANIPSGPATLVIRTEGEELRREIEILASDDCPATRIEIARR